MSQDLYAGFAGRYDLFHPNFGRHDPTLVSFFRQVFDQNHVRRVLDCACGTGQHLVLFDSLGCDVVGSDISESMLAHARSNLSESRVRVPLHRVDYRELPGYFSQLFDAVVCLSSSILHMPDDTQVARAFKSMHQVLRDGGVLVLTQGTTDRQWRERPRFVLAVNQAGFSRLFVIDYHGRGARYNVVDTFHGKEAEGLKVWRVDYPQVLLRDDLERLLGAADFQPIRFYGSYGFAPYDKEESGRLIAVAHKAVPLTAMP